MAFEDLYILKYHHGGELAKGRTKYITGSVTEFTVDPDKLCYWDVLGDVKELGFDIKKPIELTYVDDLGSLKIVCND